MSDRDVNSVALNEGEYQISGERTSRIIAAEIVAIKEQTSGTLRTIAVSAAVEIGKRLKEAKSLVPYGGWGDWLKDSLAYSERTAQNLMKLAEENEKGGLAPLMDVGYTQAVQLIGLPARDREAFLEENDVDGMTTRDLQAAVKRYEEENAGLQLRIDKLKADRKDGLTANQADELNMDLEKAKADTRAAENKAKGHEKTIARLTEDLEKAKQVQLKDAQVMAQAKAEIPEAVQNELNELREQAKQRKAAADAASSAMTREGAEYSFRALYEQFKNDFERMVKSLAEIDDMKREKYRGATVKALETMKERLMQ